MKKRCSKCYKIKARTEYYRNKKSKDGLEYICKICSRRRYYNTTKNKDGLYDDNRIDRHFLYGKGDVMRKKQYLKDRAELFAHHGNGWWWGMNEGKRKPVSLRQKKRFAGRFTR